MTCTRRAITHVVNGFGIGGTERQLVTLLRVQHAAGFDVDLCCLELEGEFLEDVRALGHEPAQFGLRGTFMQPNTFRQAQALAARIRAHGSEVVHCHDFYSNLVGSLAARLAGVPYIVSRRDIGVWIGPVRASVLQLATRSAPAVLCNARAIERFIVARDHVDPARITVVHNALDMNRFDAQLAAPLVAPLPGGKGPFIAVVGNMKHAAKGHAELLHAIAQARTDGLRARWLLLGDGALRPGLEALARALGIADVVHFLGRRTDVPAVLSRCQLLVSASRAEGLPNGVMEGMAARLPIVATDVGGTNELVTPGETGLLVPPRAPVGSSRVDLQACKLEYSIVSPK